MDTMKEFVEYIVKSIVDNPDQVDLKEVVGSRTTVFELHVAQPDLGKVIGRGGATARSIRILLSAMAARQGKRAVLEILED